MFESLMQSIDATVVERIFRVQPNNAQRVQQSPKGVEIKQEVFTGSLKDEALQAEQSTNAPSNTKGSMKDFAQALGSAKAPTQTAKPGVAHVKIGRNDPCPCGSGKKYKKCHGKAE